MPAPASLALVVPVFNETERFSERAPELFEFATGLADGSELIFVDDGSTDGTAAAIRSSIDEASVGCARVLECPHRGKGAAVRAGLASARSRFAGYCDVDLATPLSSFQRVFDAALESHGLAIGSRDVAGADLVRPESRRREFLGRGYNRLVQATLAPGIADTQCGAKVAPMPVWRTVLRHSSESGFAWDVEAIALAMRLGVPVREVPVTWCHDDRTKVRVTRDGAGMVFAVPRILRSVRRVRRLAVRPRPALADAA